MTATSSAPPGPDSGQLTVGTVGSGASGHIHPVITAADASMAAGKTTRTVMAAMELAKQGLRVLILGNSHRVCAEIVRLGRVHARTDGRAALLHMAGKRPETCRKANPESAQCSSCSCFRWGFTGGQVTSEALDASTAACKGQILDLADLARIAQGLDTCARVLALAQALAPGRVIVAPHAYLVSPRGRRIIQQIAPDRIVIDEGDAFLDALHSHHQLELSVAGAREKADAPHSWCSPTRCQPCRLDFASTAISGTGIGIAERGCLQTRLHDPDRFLDLLRDGAREFRQREVLGEVTRGLIDGVIFGRNFRLLAKLLRQPAFSGPGSTADVLARLDFTKMALPTGVRIESLDATALGLPPASTPFTVPVIKLEPSLTASGEEVILSEIDQHPTKVALKRIFVEGQVPQSMPWSIQAALRAFLQFNVFCQRAAGDAALWVDRKYSESPSRSLEDWKDSLPHCGISLRMFDVKGFRTVVDQLVAANALLLSGTLLDGKRVARALLLEPEQVHYKNGLQPLPETVDVRTVNVKRGSGLRRPKHLVMGWPELLQLYQELSGRLRGDCRILHFEPSGRDAMAFYRFAVRQQGTLSGWTIEVDEGDDVRRNWESSGEHDGSLAGRPYLRIDKLRSRTARGVNRATFTVCVVSGTGLPSLGSFIPFTLAHRTLRSHDPATLFDFVRYNRDRAVLQALMRIPRDPRPRACLWLNSDTGRRSLPAHIAVGAFDLDDVISPEALVVRGAQRMRAQILSIADFVEARVHGAGNIRRPPAASPAPRASSPINGAAIGVAERMALKFAEKFSPDRRAQASRAVMETIAYIGAVIREQGFLDRVHHKRGDRTRWLALLRFLEECRFLRLVTRPGSSKTAYVRGDLYDVGSTGPFDMNSGEEPRSEGDSDE